MSDADDIFNAMDDALFQDYGSAATVQRDAGEPVSVLAIVDRGVQRFGDYGQATHRVDMVTVRNREFALKVGDLVAIEGGAARKVDAIVGNDGFVTKAALYG